MTFGFGFALSAAEPAVQPAQPVKEVAAPAQAVEIEELQMSVDLDVLVSTGLEGLGVQGLVDVCHFNATCNVNQGCAVGPGPTMLGCWDCTVGPNMCCYGFTCAVSDNCC